MSKEELRKKFSKSPDRYYKVKLFDEEGFVRKQCSMCGKFFWTLDKSREICPDQPCHKYDFIDNSPTKKMDYIKVWEVIEKFFVKNGHLSVPSYPVVCRWFPGLYFTVASIVAFQRSLAGKTTFEMPANPLIIPQSCLRFPDIENVGRTGRHLTNFVMIGQHSILDGKSGYWKDKCIDLDYRLLREVFKIKKEEIVFLEDVWQGPSAFGSSLEYFVRGLELGNAVFTEFIGTADNYVEMDQKVIDMGAGLERFTWLSQGTPTCYDAVFGPVIKNLMKCVDYDKKLFMEYSKISGELGDLENKDEQIVDLAKRLKISVADIKKFRPLEALYAIADHSKTLLFAITDGALPSNVGGGYNLRVVLRRALGFIDEFGFDIDLNDVCKAHAMYLKKMNPRLTESLNEVYEILDVEKKRFSETKKRSIKIMESLSKKEITPEKMIELYESNGITPELMEKATRRKMPENFYSMLSEKHLSEKTEEKPIIDISGLPPTKLLFYEDQNKMEFVAKVLKIIDNKFVVLDQTCFYGRSGGQEPDRGSLGNCEVYDVEKVGSVIIHHVRNPDFNEGSSVSCSVDKERRIQLTKHHTATHIINAIARRVFGNHIWQHSAYKDMDKARLDITHYEAISADKIERIEKLANDAVKKNLPVKKIVLPRLEAEKKYGFRIYQGGAVPERELRIVETSIDVEACGGLHCDSTGEVGEIMIIRSERVQDGIVRIEFTADKATVREKARQAQIVDQSSKILGVPKEDLVKATENLFNEWKKLKKYLEMKDKAKAKELEKEIKQEGKVVVKILRANANELKNMTKDVKDGIMILFGRKDKSIVAAGSGINIGEFVSEIAAELKGKGGGSSTFAQGFYSKKPDIEKIKKMLDDRL